MIATEPADAIPDDALNIALAILEKVLDWDLWVHRRVDSFRPGDGERGVMRISIDCLPQGDNRLALWTQETRKPDLLGGANGFAGPILLPLTMFKKEPLRDFSAQFEDGTPISIRGKADSSLITGLILWLAFGADEVTLLVPDEEVQDVLFEIAQATAQDGTQIVRELTRDGTYRGKRIIEHETLGPLSRKLLADFAREFLVLAVVDQDRLEKQQVIKLEYHIRVTLAVPSFLEALGAALGATEFEYEIPMHTPYAARSYHLEFHTPPNLRSTWLEVPAGDLPSTTHIDSSGDPVAHVHATYYEAPGEAAFARMRVPMSGLWFAAMAVTVLGTALFVGSIFMPGAAAHLRENIELSATVYFALALIPVGLVVFKQESSLETYVYQPIRALLLFNAVLLAIDGLMFAGQLAEPYFTVLTAIMLLAHLGLSLAMLVPRLHEITSVLKQI